MTEKNLEVDRDKFEGSQRRLPRKPLTRGKVIVSKHKPEELFAPQK